MQKRKFDLKNNIYAGLARIFKFLFANIRLSLISFFSENRKAHKQLGLNIQHRSKLKTEIIVLISNCGLLVSKGKRVLSKKISNHCYHIMLFAKSIRPNKEIGIIFAFITISLSVFFYEYETQQSSKNWEKYQETHVQFDDALEEIIFKERELFYGQKNRITKLDQRLTSLTRHIDELNIVLDQEKVKNNDSRLEIVRLNQALEITTKSDIKKDEKITRLQTAIRNQKIRVDNDEKDKERAELAAIDSAKMLPPNSKLKALNLKKPDVGTSEFMIDAMTVDEDEKKQIPTTEEKQHKISDGNSEESIVFVAIGETLSSILQKIDVSESEAKMVISSLKGVYDPRKLKSGQKIIFRFRHTGNPEKPLDLQKIAWPIDNLRDVVISRRENNSFFSQISEIEKAALKEKLVVKTGLIKSSLYDSATKQGVPVMALYEMVDAFAYDVDFQRDVKRNDKFEIFYKASVSPEGKLLKTEVLYGSLSLSGNVMQIYRYENGDNIPAFYDRSGGSVQRSLMKTPINGARLSSHFGMRKHPILGYSKMHRGVDFAASRGTSIKAAGSGIIVAIGKNGSYGNYIEIKHNSVYKTAYAHLGKFAKGLAKNRKVHQAQTIGYVGSTGRSTGPHLHFEILKFGKRVNPMNVNLPTGKKLKKGELVDFRTKVIEIEEKLASLNAEPELARKSN